LVIAPLFFSCAGIAAADDQPAAEAASNISPEKFAVHGQFTYVEQETSSFNAPYAGPNSLSPDSGRETTDATLYLGGALWSGAEVWINGEVDQGFGLNNTLGVAGFPSAEAYKVGKNQPYLRFTRGFVRDTFNLDGDQESVEGAQNQLAGSRSENRWVLTIGKVSVGDIFDINPYAHDPRGDFLNWTAVDAGTFDYAADAWGYTVGAAVEWYQGPWTEQRAPRPGLPRISAPGGNRASATPRRSSRECHAHRVRQPRSHGLVGSGCRVGAKQRQPRGYRRRAPV
jgi:high affinity Mn2+ porin